MSTEDELITCPVCNGQYSNFSYFKRHLNYKSKQDCKKHYFRMKTPPQKKQAVGLEAPVALEQTDLPSTHNDGSQEEMPLPESPILSPFGYFPAVDSPTLDEKIDQLGDGYDGPTPVVDDHLAEERDDFLPEDRYEVEDVDEEEGDEEEEEEEEDEQLPIFQPGFVMGEYDPDPEPLRKFQAFANHAYHNFTDIPPEYKAGIELMNLLIEARAPLVVYDRVSNWHSANSLCKRRVSREQLLKFLNDRYYGHGRMPKLSAKVTLPHSQARVRLAVSDVMENLVSMLTDPRIEDDDYLLKDNPLEPPTNQDELTHIADINTGTAYIETWKKLVKDPEVDLPWPNILYIDSAVTGQNNSMPIEALKITNGFLKREARDRPYASRKIRAHKVGSTLGGRL